ncbi:MAG: RtcB family protein [Spirochaetes bacterium]|nr:RtcB family protein [Spirochaetota bacterium]
MRVDGLVFASQKILDHIKQEETYKQIMNVACLPGILKYSIGMPDIHWGYGFPIGGVAAIQEEGVVSPGGVGSDINCGVRTLLLPLRFEQIKSKKDILLNKIYDQIPVGVGRKGKIRVSHNDLTRVSVEGVRWAITRGMGMEEDLDATEDNGKLNGSLDHVSQYAIQRGLPQLGSLGAGNHFIEIQRVEQIYNSEIAEKWGLFKDQVAVMIHTGSRGFGHQVCEDYLQSMQNISHKYKIKLPDKQLACAPIDSKEGKEYLSAMAAAANYAWCNRQIISHFIREVIVSVFKLKYDQIALLFDVAHNIAKFEDHEVDGKTIRVLIHRKGATRAFPAHHPVLSKKYSSTGQPVIIPGDMGTASYILLGTEQAIKESFGTVCHGAGRILSRKKAKKIADKESFYKKMKEKGISLKAPSWNSVAEEIPQAYKNIHDVIDVVEKAQLANRVARLVPVAVIKG